MSRNRSFLSLLTILAAVSTANCGQFSLHFSFPPSPFLIDRILCANLLGKTRCSITEKPLKEINRPISFDFEGPNKARIEMSISLVKNVTAPWYRKQLTVGSTRFLPINNASIIVTLRCQKDFFGAACDLHCVSDSRKICDSHGQFSCNEGWNGPDCNEGTSLPTVRIPSTSLPSTTTDVPSHNRITRESSVDVNLFYGMCLVLLLIFIIFLFVFCILPIMMAVLLILIRKMNSTSANAFESMRRMEEVNSQSPIFFTNVESTKADFDERDSGRHSFNSGEVHSTTFNSTYTQIEMIV